MKIQFQITLLLSLLTSQIVGQDFYAYKNNTTHTYEEAIQLYQQLSDQYDNATLYEIGKTDVGKPLYLFLINEELETIKESNKTKIFINNGIHPGEPCGVDASLIFSKNILEDSLQLSEEIAIAIIPIYNVGGALNRSGHSRANQNGPKQYGFRGNAQNLDLNRDFIKMDSENAKSFARAFHAVDPHVIIDTHTTNGADYQYNMTLLPTVPEQLSPEIGDFFQKEVIPSVFERMEKAEEKSIPYVNLKEKTPEDGIVSYYDSPRYTTGYASLFHCWGFTSEAHMLKPFPKRVEATYTFLKVILEYVSDHTFHIKKFKKDAVNNSWYAQHPVHLENDLSKYVLLKFDGYKHQYKKSHVTGMKRLMYDTNKKETFEIRHYNHFKVNETINSPDYYVIPQHRKDVVELLKLNQCKVKVIENDTTILAKTYYVDRQESLNQPYEGHFYHTKIEISPVVNDYHFYKGDFIIEPDSYTAKFLAHVLHPYSTDSYLRWNFFDEIFQQKEWFSPYVFEELAEEILTKDKDLQERFNQKKIEDSEFAENARQQLYFIYVNSKYYEKTHKLYPVYRIQQNY